MKKIELILIFNFIYTFLNIKTKVNQFFKKISLESIVLLNFKKRQPKINFIDLQNDKKYIYTIGLVLKILNIFKKCNRRVPLMIKNVITFVIKKHQIDLNKAMFIIKGFHKKLVKIIYMFKPIFNYLSLFYIQPLKTYKMISIKKKRSIKRRIFKKLVAFSNK